MHFMLNKENKIAMFHLETWDRENLGEKLVNEINKHVGKRLEEFLIFALRKKLYLKTVTMYVIEENGNSIYFWSDLLCLYPSGQKGIQMAEERFIQTYKQLSQGKYLDSMRVCTFYLTDSKENDKIQKFAVITDIISTGSISKMNKREEFKVIFYLKEKEIKEIALDFGRARNLVNYIFYLTFYEDDRVEKHADYTSQLAFIVAKGKIVPTLEVLDKKALIKITKDKAIKEEYLDIVSTQPNSREQQIEIHEILKKFSDKIKSQTS